MSGPLRLRSSSFSCGRTDLASVSAKKPVDASTMPRLPDHRNVLSHPARQAVRGGNHGPFGFVNILPAGGRLTLLPPAGGGPVPGGCPRPASVGLEGLA